MPLDQSLASVPGLAGFLAKRQMNEQGLGGDIQQLSGALSLSDRISQKKDEDQIKAVIESGASPEKVVTALMSMGPKGAAAAHQYAAALKDLQASKTSEGLRNLSPQQLQDPEMLDRLGASGVPGTAHFTGAADRLRKQAEAQASLKAMQSGAQTIQPDPQEMAQAADQGTPAPVPAQVKRGGMFDDLAKSEIPHIAQAAKSMQAQLDRSGATIPPAYWQKQHETLAGREASYLQAKSVADAKKTDAQAGALTDDDAGFMAGQYLAGDRTVMQNLGRGAQGAENIVKIRREIAKQAKESGASPRDVAAAIGEFEGFKSGQRALGTRQAQLEIAANVTKQFAPLAIEASEKFDRTGIKSLNDLEKAALERTSSPELRRFNFANTSLINAYARAINPSGVPTVSDKEHARQILDTGFSKGDYAAAVDQLNKEIDAELKAPGAVKRQMRDFMSSGGEPPAAAPTAAPPASAQRIKFDASGNPVQ